MLAKALARRAPAGTTRLRGGADNRPGNAGDHPEADGAFDSLENARLPPPASTPRSSLRYEANDYFKLSFGRFHTPINYWNTAFHHGQWSRLLRASLHSPAAPAAGPW
jgi:hypothetical protein